MRWTCRRCRRTGCICRCTCTRSASRCSGRSRHRWNERRDWQAQREHCCDRHTFFEAPERSKAQRTLRMSDDSLLLDRQAIWANIKKFFALRKCDSTSTAEAIPMKKGELKWREKAIAWQ